LKTILIHNLKSLGTFKVLTIVYFISHKNLLRRLLFFICVSLLLLYPYGIAQGETSADDIAWQSIETKHTVIHYQTMEDLKKFNKKVVYYSARQGLKSLFSTSADNLTDKLKKKVDALFKRVQEVLDMRKRTNRVIINIYHDKKQLRAAYYEIFKKKCSFRGWYLYERNTIHINVDDLNEGILAHEMAHSIIDHYFAIRPPKATAEILARYVDKHLSD